MPHLVTPGIYQILNVVNGERYIGSSKDLLTRWAEHIRALRKGRHTNKRLQSSWNEYGEDNFRFLGLEHPRNRKLTVLEQKWMDRLKPELNMSPFVTGRRPGPLTAIHRKRISESHIGIGHTEETKEKLRKINTGKKHTLEARKKMSIAHKGRKFSAKHRAALSAAMIGNTRALGNMNFLGRHHSLETRRKMSIAHTGKHPSEETKRKISLANKGRKFTEAHRANIALAWKRRREKDGS